MDIDFSQYTDDELAKMYEGISDELDHRQTLARIPGQVAKLRRTYTAGGGDPAVLEQAVTGDVDSGDHTA